MRFARLEIDAVNRAAEVYEYASGKSVNVARVLHTCGERVLAVGLLGGEAGRIFRRDLERSGIPHDFVETAAPTRMCLTAIDDSTGTVTELIEEAPPVDESEWKRLSGVIGNHINAASAVVMSEIG